MAEIDLGLGVLDHQLLDCDGRRCGKVDDLELDLEHEGGPRVAAILAGPGAWRHRGRLGRLAAARSDGTVLRVPWEDVREVHAGVALARRAADYGLARGDEILGPVFEHLPGAEL